MEHVGHAALHVPFGEGIGRTPATCKECGSKKRKLNEELALAVGIILMPEARCLQVKFASAIMATPQIPGGKCLHCQAPVVDVFAEWTDEYQTTHGKKAIMAGDVVFDCYYCEGLLQLILPLALIPPQKGPDDYKVAKRMKSRCENWLRSQHPGQSLTQVIEAANWQNGSKWAFDGYNWGEGSVHHHGQDNPPIAQGTNP